MQLQGLIPGLLDFDDEADSSNSDSSNMSDYDERLATVDGDREEDDKD